MPPKRRRRFQGLYYHSSPPKVIPMNGQLSNQNGRKRKEVDDFSVKLSTIRIWMHEKDIGNLTRILWAGQGNRLRQQASTNPKVKRFLAAVPYAMNSIKDVHQAVIDNNLETLQATLEPPVPPALITCKDANGLNAIHKAAGMGHTKILEYLIGIWPDGINEIDITGKTPLHWAASAKNNMRCYTLLTQAGCDEEVLDYKMKTPSYYRHKPNEIERAFLVYVPEAPRVSPGIATDWEALCDDGGDGKKLDIKIPEINGFSLRTTDDSIENTSEADLNDGVSGTEEDEMTKDDEVAPIENGLESVPATPDNLDESADPDPEPEPEPVEIESNEIAATEPENENADSAENNTLIETTMTTEQDDNEQTQNDGDDNNQADPDEKVAETEVDEATKEESKNAEDHVADEDETAQKDDAVPDEEVEDDGPTEDDAGREHSVNGHNDNDELNEDPEVVEKGVQNNEENSESIVNEQEENKSGNEEETTLTKNEEDIIEINNNNKIDLNDNEIDESNKTQSIEQTDKTEDDVKIDSSNGTELINDNKENNNEEVKEKLSMNTQQDLETGEETVVEANDLNEDAVVAELTETTLDVIEEPDRTNDAAAIDKEDIVTIQDTKDENAKNDIKTAESDAEEDDEEDDEDPRDQPDDDEDDDDEEEEDTAEAEPEAVSDEPETEPNATTTRETEEEQLDENHNEEKYDVDSPTSSLAIEGFVQGESEDNTVQSQSAAFVDEASHIQEIIASGDMEQLAQIVLNGDGSKLLDMQSPEPEIQAFLNNVPNYMSKIRRVHEAAREGSLLSLQQALDRRKFAIAKDEISANGATPLHVAVLFGHSDIVRYLAARFTETTTVTDNDGRTALHYAATIKDNGHFYNVLTQLGANYKAMDKLGHTPEFYLDAVSSKDILSYGQLLNNFGAADLEAALLSDQGQVENHSFQSNPIFKTEQGKYLANTLADPLIKALTEIANTRPEDPIAFLTDFLQTYMRSRNPNAIHPAEVHPSSSKTNSTAVVNSNSPPMRKANNIFNGAAMTNGNIDAADIEEDRISTATEDEEAPPQFDDRDEHGQSMLHFACARSHRRGGLLHLIEESNIDITYRDELYRTARDVSLQANQPANAKEIDRFVLALAVVGDLKPFESLASAGYDHITDVVDDNGKLIIDIAAERGHEELADFLRNLRSFEESREELHQMIRDNNTERIKEIIAASNAKWLLKAKNYYGRTALHIAVLKESEEIVEWFVKVSPEVLRVGDNLERTALHYAMGTNAIESISRILIQRGAKRTSKDLKGRQPSYYFMNKADILRLQEEEDENH